MTNNNDNLPTFFIVGAMKCGTSTLYSQLSNVEGIFLPSLKEPNYFNDDNKYHTENDWYKRLFDGASVDDIVGEASTHYTKLPTYPNTIPRLKEFNPDSKIVYLMRHPVDRLISHYIHEWSLKNTDFPIDEEVIKKSKYIDYGLYDFQVTPYIDAFGPANVLPVFLERMIKGPEQEFSRILQHIGYKGEAVWNHSLEPANVSAERIRKFPGYNLLINSTIATKIRRSLIPHAIRDEVKNWFSISARPFLQQSTREELSEIFNQDLERLGNRLRLKMNCDNYSENVESLGPNYGFMDL